MPRASTFSYTGVVLPSSLLLGTSSYQSGICDFRKQERIPRRAIATHRLHYSEKICLSTYLQVLLHVQWLNMYSLFCLLPKHILTLCHWKKHHSFTQVYLITRVHEHVINTISKSALVFIYWHLKCIANKYHKWELEVVKKLLQCCFMLPQKMMSSSYAFVLNFKNRNIIQLHLGKWTTLSF